MKSFIFLSAVLIFSGCGTSTDPSRTQIFLQIELPSGLRRETRLGNFDRRVVLATVRFESKKGLLVEQTLAPGQWDAISVPQLDFPTGTKDILEIHVRIWDRNREGLPRNYPVLTGHAHVRADELNEGQPNTVSIRLSLAVSVSDYD